ncbi:molybdopterin molybdotransferase MoeA [Salegentibacter sp. F188]|uniref:Molybdopterin molybdenumtransferase n=1 Tax=Autumnicola patrickiae TaxID=3075591 RepID=A0ABU3DWZ6_9FLAO|nr:gephyrin-like molybdotransferase Glp [Salegentibacter sp. F188]MDT0688249.1 molybdopterin molybdotransferase MoeA [Salegentibacter sp. F188]
MISVNEARKILSDNSTRGKIETVLLGHSLQAIIAEDIHSPIDVPSFDNSAMDGYALKFDTKLQHWKVNTMIQAGDTSEYKIEKGQAARIFTGAKIPEGTDTVIPQELIEKDEVSGGIIYQQDKTSTGSNVRLKGSQCKRGELILKKGTVISPGVIGLLASVGLAKVKIYKAPTVAYIITGDELKEPGTSLKPGEIYNSNGPMLEALLKKSGITDIFPEKASDKKEELQKIIDEALEQQDVLILSGGISVGDYDFVKECLENAGVQELFYKIKQRPGKPMFAGKKGEKWIFALPGNPASVLSCFNQYVKPCLYYFMGRNNVWNADSKLILAGDHKKKPGLTFFLKGRTNGDEVEILGAQQSFNLQAFSTANCLVELAEDKEEVEAGTLVKVYIL